MLYGSAAVPCADLSGHMNENGEGLRRSAPRPLAPVRAWTDHELNGEIGVAAYGPLSPDTSYRHSTLSFADRAPVIGVPKARYTVPPRGWLSGSGGGRPGTEARESPHDPSGRRVARLRDRVGG